MENGTKPLEVNKEPGESSTTNNSIQMNGDILLVQSSPCRTLIGRVGNFAVQIASPGGGRVYSCPP